MEGKGRRQESSREKGGRSEMDEELAPLLTTGSWVHMALPKLTWHIFPCVTFPPSSRRTTRGGRKAGQGAGEIGREEGENAKEAGTVV